MTSLRVFWWVAHTHTLCSRGTFIQDAKLVLNYNHLQKDCKPMGIKLCTHQAQPKRFMQSTLGPDIYSYSRSDKCILRPWSLLSSEVLHLRTQPVDLFNADQKHFIMSSSTNTVQAHNLKRKKEKKRKEKGKQKGEREKEKREKERGTEKHYTSKNESESWKPKNNLWCFS